MRLTEAQVDAIRRTAAEVFGPYVELRLFGSRVDDTKRGGDIDLYLVTADESVRDLVSAEVDFLSRLKRRIGEQRIDLLVDYPSRRHRPPILSIAKATGVRL